MISVDPFEKMVAEVQKHFPKLTAIKKNGKTTKLVGDIDICGNDGEYFGTFKILIELPNAFPLAVPKVYEISHKIKRIEDRHMYQNGECCLDMEHELQFMAGKEIKLSDFILTKVYPFLANQIYFESIGKFAGEEYEHGFDGIRQFYKEKLHLGDPSIILKILDSIMHKRIQGRNDPCCCGSNKKLKNCHLHQIEYLSSILMDQIQKDYIEFDNFSKKGLTS